MGKLPIRLSFTWNIYNLRSHRGAVVNTHQRCTQARVFINLLAKRRAVLNEKLQNCRGGGEEGEVGETDG